MTLTPNQYATVPLVRAAMVDTILPAAVQLLPAQLTVLGTTFDLSDPQVYYGEPSDDTLPAAGIAVGDSSGTTEDRVTVPDNSPTYRAHAETYDLSVVIWYEIGDTGANAQRYATEAAWAIYKAVAQQVRSQPNLGVLFPPGTAFMRAVDDQDYKTDLPGRMCVLRSQLRVNARI